ncbi:LysR substrate-binding domain-containing protein [Variovorax sp. J31P207]|uniref:LysR substrate-binding domain-containing protein n=1 Tax=Variovorax sp. J31P207 TaxID=3053510 RepID=UPI00257590DD|nr:LysR substrate-binding domain-containing protein [Variovorax sp. J31P207]MDM0072666.1 LysR substrate-binding domain-containing protein [Variovorax sp. J31P207]
MHKLRNLLGPLRVFDAVSRMGGVSRAAEQLHVTPGAVSQQLKQLEGAVGVKLFRKAGREIELTDPGRQLALRMLDLFDRVESAVAEAAQSGKPKRLRLKVIPTFAIKWLVPRLASFYALHDDIDVEIASVTRFDDQHLENADFVVRLGVGQWQDVHFDHLFNDAFVPVCSPAVAAMIHGPRDLLQAKLLHSMMRKEGWPIWLKSAGFGDEKPQNNLTLANSALCLQAATDGLGVAMAQQAYVAEDIQNGRLVVPVDHVAETETGYYLICDLHKANTFPVKAFRDWIRTVI